MAARVVAVIPARWASTRLHGKMLADIQGKPLILRTLENTKRATILDDVIVATDDNRIKTVIEANGGKAVLTDPDLPSGSDRVWAAIQHLDGDIIVNVQGDEPLLPEEVITESVQLLVDNPSFDATTAASPLKPDELANPNVVKVVTSKSGKALYFSRSILPYPRGMEKNSDREKFLTENNQLFKRHIGIYVYRRETLGQFCKLPVGDLEACEKLEQLRMLENDISIGVANVVSNAVGVDTQEDLDRVRKQYTTF